MRFVRLLAALVLAAACSPSRATTVVPLTPAQVDELAHRIVEARVVSAVGIQVPGTSLSAIEYELVVERVLKDDGSVAASLASRNGLLVVRQVGLLGGDGDFSKALGMPRYEVGARYRLALNGESARGLTSPVGFAQGVQRLAEPAVPTKVTP